MHKRTLLLGVGTATVIIVVAVAAWLVVSRTKTPPELQPNNEQSVKQTEGTWACGSLHTHIMIFDTKEKNNASLVEAIAASKAVGLQFIMLSEKGEAYSGTDSWAWQNMLRTCDASSDKEFVCLSGQENCTQAEAAKKPRGHFVTINNRQHLSELLEVPKVFEEARKQMSAIIVAHPFYKRDISDMYNYTRWDILDWDAIEVIDGVIDAGANRQALEKVYELWDAGIHKSLTGGADIKNHQPNTDLLLPQKNLEDALRRGYTCLYIPTFDREAIIHAVVNGNGYASSGPRIKEFTINGAMMGQTVSVQRDEPLLIKVHTKASSSIKAMVVNNDHKALKEFHPGKQEFSTEFSIAAPAQDSWYNLEVYSEDGQAFTNAIWVKVR